MLVYGEIVIPLNLFPSRLKNTKIFAQFSVVLNSAKVYHGNYNCSRRTGIYKCHNGKWNFIFKLRVTQIGWHYRKVFLDTVLKPAFLIIFWLFYTHVNKST